MKTFIKGLVVVGFIVCAFDPTFAARKKRVDWGEGTADEAETTRSIEATETVEFFDPGQYPEPKVSGLACGQLHKTETSRSALDPQHVFYFLKVDCETVNENKGGPYFVKFGPNAFRPGQKGWVTRWRREANQNHGMRGVPIICFRGLVSGPICDGKNKSVYSNNAQNLTANRETFEAWKEESKQ